MQFYKISSSLHVIKFSFGIFLLISYQIGYRKKYCSVKFFEQIYLYVYFVSTSVMVVNTSIHSLNKIKLSTSSFILMVHATASGRFEFNQTDQTISFNYMFFLYILYWIYYNIKYIKLLSTWHRIQSRCNLGSSWQIKIGYV